MPRAGLVAVALLLSACGASDEPGRRSSARLSVRPSGSVQGAPLGYLEYLPPGYGDGAGRPLLVFLHGTDESGDGSEGALQRLLKLGVPMLIEKDDWPQDRTFVVLAPQYGGEAAQDCRIASEVDAFLRFAIEQYDIDPERVYLTGISCGAIGAWDYLSLHTNEVVAGAVLISGHAADAVAAAGCSLARVPIWAFHGDVDDIVPRARIEAPMAELEACADPAPVDLRLTVYPGVDHDAWSQTYDLSAGHDIYNWLLEHRRAQPN